MAVPASATTEQAARRRAFPWPGFLGRLWSNYLLRSLVRAIVTIWFVASLLFFLFRLLPSSPIDVFIQEAIVNRGLNVDQARAEAESLFALDLDRPVFLQYFDYMKSLASGNLGRSIVSSSTPVTGIILAFLPWTLFTVGTGLLISFTLGCLLGLVMAYRRDRPVDHALSTFAAFTNGIPDFIMGLLLLYWLGVYFKLFDIAKVRGSMTPGVQVGFTWTFFSDVLAHAWLPIFAYVLTTIATWMLQMKNAATASLEDDHVTVARARGLSNRRIISSYVGRNSILPLVSFAAIALGGALGGSAVIETLFVYRGLGGRLGESINARDYPVMQGIFLVLTAAVILSNLFADALYSRIDPRVRVGGGTR
jgi:peptide/nickel transport system permease protein